jgi:putative flippase GtrA
MIDSEDAATLPIASVPSTAGPALPTAGGPWRTPRSLVTALLQHKESRRLIAFLMAGGVSALVTITLTAVLVDVRHVAFLWSALAGTELGIIVNFSINDAFAFSDLAGHQRPLLVRLARFHVTCATGQALILLLSLVLHDVARWDSKFAQALPIALITGVNFLMHRFWTYRGSRHHMLSTWDQLDADIAEPGGGV